MTEDEQKASEKSCGTSPTAMSRRNAAVEKTREIWSCNASAEPPQKQAAVRATGALAVIMDGNGRGASRRGSRRAARVIRRRRQLRQDRRVLRGGRGIGYLTVYAFSTENWNRSDDEVGALMRIMKERHRQYVPVLRDGTSACAFWATFSR